MEFLNIISSTKIPKKIYYRDSEYKNDLLAKETGGLMDIIGDYEYYIGRYSGVNK